MKENLEILVIRYKLLLVENYVGVVWIGIYLGQSTVFSLPDACFKRIVSPALLMKQWNLCIWIFRYLCSVNIKIAKLKHI